MKSGKYSASGKSLATFAQDPWRLSANCPLETSELSYAITQYKSSHDLNACNRVIQSHLRLVAKLARSFAGPSISCDDLMAEGALALRRCLDNFDPNRGPHFTAYAGVVVRHAMRNAIRAEWERLRIPSRDRRRLLSRARQESEFYAQNGREMTAAEAPRLPRSSHCVPPSTVATRCISLDSETSSPAQLLPDSQPSPLDTAVESEELSSLKVAIESLPERVREVIRLRFGIDDDAPRSRAEIARQLQVPASIVDGMLNDGLRRLRVAMSRSAASNALTA